MLDTHVQECVETDFENEEGLALIRARLFYPELLYSFEIRDEVLFAQKVFGNETGVSRLFHGNSAERRDVLSQYDGARSVRASVERGPGGAFIARVVFVSREKNKKNFTLSVAFDRGGKGFILSRH